jgi:uncharacterized protein YbbC (DUF1343 family)
VTHDRSGVLEWKWQLAAGAVLLVAIGTGCARLAVGATRPRPVRPGIEVLLSDSLHLVQGKRVGLVANLAAVGTTGTDVVTLMRRAPVHLVALFGPEHGLSAVAAPGEKIADAVDSATRIPI